MTDEKAYKMAKKLKKYCKKTVRCSQCPFFLIQENDRRECRLDCEPHAYKIKGGKDNEN